MRGLPKCRILWVMGLLLIGVGAVCHAHAENWAFVVTQDNPKMMAIDYAREHLLEDSGISLMALGEITFTAGLIAWVYPPIDRSRH